MIQAFLNALAAIDRVTRFDAWGPESNPLIATTKRRRDRFTRFTLRRILWLAFVVGLAGMFWAMGTVLTLDGDEDVTSVLFLITGIGWVYLAISPVLSALEAARYVGRVLRPERFDLVYMTPLSNDRVVRAQVFGVIYQVRRQYGVLVALLPLMTITMFYLFLELDRLFYGYSYYGAYAPTPPRYWAVVGPTLWTLAIMLGLWGYNLLGVVFGVRMGIFRQNTLVSGMVALVGMVLLVLSPCACMWIVVLLSGNGMGFFEVVFSYVVPLLFMMLPWSAAWMLMRHTALVWQRE